MYYFRDKQGATHALDDLNFVGLLPEGCEPLTSEEYSALTAPSAGDALRAQIATLEGSVTPRRLREAAIGADNGWLAELDEQIVQLRAQLNKFTKD